LVRSRRRNVADIGRIRRVAAERTPNVARSRDVRPVSRRASTSRGRPR
jgi:hypothetical protein